MPERYQPRPPQPDGELDNQPLFQLGRLVATPGALRACADADTDPSTYVYRHSCGNWGDLDPEDKSANNWAVEHGARILSAYKLPSEVRVWIITEADRSATTLLLPEEY